MVRTLKRTTLALGVLALLLAAGPAAAQTAAKCTQSKIKAAAKKTQGKAKCHSKAVGKGIVPVDSTCLAKTEVKFSSAFAKAVAKGGCTFTDDAPVMEAKIDVLIDDLAGALGGPGVSKCTSKKYSEAGKKYSKKAGCYAKAVSKATNVDSTCLAKAEVKFSSAFAKAEADPLGNCIGPDGDAPVVEAMLDAVLEDTLAELGVGCRTLPAPFARAATITTSADLIGGPLARGQMGDFILENDLIRVIIQQPGRIMMGIGTFGGNIIDADLRRSCGPERDHFEEIAPLINIENTANYTSVVVLNDGTNSLPAVIRATGPDDLLDFINPSSTVTGMGLAFPAGQDDVNLPITVQTDYILEMGKPYVRVETTITNTDLVTPVNTFFGDIANGSGEVEEFEPGSGFGEPLVTTTCPPGTYKPCSAVACDACDYVAWAGENGGAGVSYGYIHAADGSSNFNTSGVTVTIHGREIALVLTGLQTFNQTILPTMSKTFTRYFAVGDGTVSSIADIRNTIRGFTTIGTLTGTVTSGGVPVPEADVVVFGTPYSAPLVGGPAKNIVQHFRTDEHGVYTGTLPAGMYPIRAQKDGREFPVPLSTTVTITAGMTTTQNFTLPAPGRIKVTVRDENGDPIPAKVQLAGLDPSPDPLNTQSIAGLISTTTGVFGSDLPETDARPYGIAFVDFANQYGEITSSEMEPGSYQLVVSRGPRYSAFKQNVTVTSGATTTVAAQIAKVIDTPGFITGDFHVHAINSADSEVTNEERVATQLAEGTDFFTPSDHEIRVDFAPVVAAMGVGHLIATAPSSEITTFDYGHYNSWPQPVTGALNGGSIDHGRAGIAPGMDFPSLGSYSLSPSEIYAEAHMTPGALIQINHMRSHFDRGGLAIDTATTPPSSTTPPLDRRLDPGVLNHFDDSFDALEVWIGTDGRNGELGAFVGENLGDWFNMLNQGILRAGVADSDTHQMRETQINARSFVASAVTDPGMLAGQASTLAANIVAGKVTGSNGPFVKITSKAPSTGEVGGLEVGDSNLVSTTDGAVDITITVKSPLWAEFDKIQFFVNNAPQPFDDDSDAGTPDRYRALRNAVPACDPLYGCFERVKVTDFTITTVDDFPAITDAKHYEATYTLNLTGLTDDSWVVALVRGTDNVSKPLYPVVPSSILPKACANDPCRACAVDGDCSASTCTVNNLSLAQLTDGNLNQCGSLALAFTNPLYIDADNDNVWTAPGVMLSPP